MEIIVSPSVSQTYPGACAGFLAVETSGVPAGSPLFEDRKAAVLADLRARYPDDASLKADPVLQAYAAYYKHFKKTYHVTLQLESVAQKGKGIPPAPPLVQCMFLAELQNRLLTAGHDLSILQAAGDRVTVNVAQGDESYTLMRGTSQVLKAGDLFIADGEGVISDIIYGPDQRTQITPQTTAALFAVYAPPGIGKDRVMRHLETMWDYVRLVSAGAQVLRIEVND